MNKIPISVISSEARNLFINIRQRFLIASTIGMTLIIHSFTIMAQSNVTLPMFTQFDSDSFRIHLKAICKNVPMNGLNLSNFTFKENGSIINSVQLVRKANTTASDCFDAALVINRSGDMNTGFPRYIDQVKDASKKFIDDLRPSCDKAALISFADDVSLDAFLSADKVKMKQQIDSIKTGGKISMWDAAYLAMIELLYNGSNATRSVIIFTNGDDNSSETSSKYVIINFARQNNISIYIVGGFNSTFDSTSMKYVATRTGGKFFFTQDGSGLNSILTAITNSIRDEHLQYQFELKAIQTKVRKRIYEIDVSGCDNILITKYYFDSGSGTNPPAPFTLNSSTIRNTDLFRIDHTGCNVPDDYALDTLRLRWQPSTYNEPFLDDTVKYYWNAILDSAGTQITTTMLSDNQGKSPSLTLDGLTIYDKLFRRANLTNPDSLVIRVPWFVKAVNTTGGETYSDTAGVTKRVYTPQSPPTLPLMFSINRRPDKPIQTSPQDGDIIMDVRINSFIYFNWKFNDDINTVLCKRIGGFKVYDQNSKSWVTDPGRVSDTLVFQVRVEVVENFPKNRGVAIGTTIIIPAGELASGVTINSTVINTLFNGINNPATRVDSVRIKWSVDVKDFNYTNGKQPVTFDSIWSGVGCRPHISTSDSRTILLIRGTDPTSVQDVQPNDLGLSQNYPNPFSSSTTIEIRNAKYDGQTESGNSLKVYDLLGREVLDLTEQTKNNSSVVINKSQLPKAGVYIYRLQNGNEMISRKMIVIE